MNKIVSNYIDTYIHRYDQDNIIHYFSSSNFPLLNEEKISFRSGNNILNGKLFNYKDYASDSLIVFVHGIGPGYIAYMKEIVALCKRGLQVLAYDATGCESSPGENIRGLTQSLADLDSCLTYIKNEERFKNKKIHIIGHSWGGYAAGNILNYHKDIASVVVISGFVSIKQMIKQKCNGIKKIGIPFIMNYEKKVNKKYYRSSSISALNNAQCKVLLIHSLDDRLVIPKYSFLYAKKKIKNTNVNFIEFESRKHNPNYLEDAVNYMMETFKDYALKCANSELKTTEQKQEYMNNVDWDRMTQQDEKLFDNIVLLYK